MSIVRAADLDRFEGYKQSLAGATCRHGSLEMEFERHGDHSVLTHLYRQAPLVVQQALYWDEYLPEMPCVFIITSSGCVLEDDRLEAAITVGRGAMAHVTTQAATKIHQMGSGYAVQIQNVCLKDDAYLELMPGPVIPHRHSRFISNTCATVADSATLLTAEILQPGRMHHGEGEIFQYDLYSSALTVARPGGTSLCSEKIVCEPQRHPVSRAGEMGDFKVLATVTLLSPPIKAEVVRERALDELDVGAGCIAGASRLPNAAGLVYKVLGYETEPVKATVRDFWRIVRGAVLGRPIPELRSWG